MLSFRIMKVSSFVTFCFRLFKIVVRFVVCIATTTTQKWQTYKYNITLLEKHCNQAYILFKKLWFAKCINVPFLIFSPFPDYTFVIFLKQRCQKVIGYYHNKFSLYDYDTNWILFRNFISLFTDSSLNFNWMEAWEVLRPLKC